MTVALTPAERSVRIATVRDLWLQFGLGCVVGFFVGAAVAVSLTLSMVCR